MAIATALARAQGDRLDYLLRSARTAQIHGAKYRGRFDGPLFLVNAEGCKVVVKESKRGKLTFSLAGYAHDSSDVTKCLERAKSL